MPKDAFTLSDVREPTLTVVCEPCGRRGRYNVARLIEKHGDMRLPDLPAVLANCPKAHSASIHDRCKARHEGLTTR
jgi:hypothetical protein